MSDGSSWKHGVEDTWEAAKNQVETKFLTPDAPDWDSQANSLSEKYELYKKTLETFDDEVPEEFATKVKTTITQALCTSIEALAVHAFVTYQNNLLFLKKAVKAQNKKLKEQYAEYNIEEMMQPQILKKLRGKIQWLQ